MSRLITAAILACLLAFAGTAEASDSLLMANISGDVIAAHSPVATDTGVVTVVTKVELGAGTITCTVADALASDSAYMTTAKRARWNINVLTYQKNTTPDTDSLRYVYVYGKGSVGQPQVFILTWNTEVDTLPTAWTWWTDIDSIKAVRYEAGDSVAVLAFCQSSMRSGIGFGLGSSDNHLIGMTSAAVQPRQRGYVICSGLARGKLQSAALAGSFALPGASVVGTVDDVVAVPDSGWVIGQILQRGAAADVVPIWVNIMLIPQDSL